ncbi:hypothetical protein Sulac_0380 [Sulfobacillus acidophilus DSM 10332]|uniref:Uncharacterized protein n=1 Tax=Sulfobacillus acidophilus (strain ATCC 700253 / DSM 10332 / NAL) TaxID=679936 RepID=G8TY41_SULAD|nr:hypothetical protein Sulac_0380 [Sulfobacillus acidophilus DSM 10332]
MGKLVGGLARGIWWVGQRAWGHPVLRLVLLGLVSVWLLPVWVHAAGERQSWIVVSLVEIWFLLSADAIHHLWPPVGQRLWPGYVLLGWPWLSTIVGSRWVAAGLVAFIVAGILLVKRFTNSKGVGSNA